MMRKKLHKTLLVILLVVTPIYFLMFTDEGKRITDNAVLWLVSGKSAALNFKALDAGYTREQVMQVFSELEWQCHEETSKFGDNLCATRISSFNTYPAKFFSTFFAGDRLTAIRVVYYATYHDQLIGHLIHQLGQPRNAPPAGSETPASPDVLEWETGSGLVVLKRSLGPDEEASLFWLAHAP